MQRIAIRTNQRQELVNLADEIQAAVTETGVSSGVCYVYCPHTTGGIVVNSYRDPNTPRDITHEIDRLIPTRVDFFHINDTPSDAAAHVKSSLVGISQVFLIDEGRLVLGHSQGILFAEFDGPRDRHVLVKVIAG
ncbi:MAG TPA: secondary thiamine-phosphate synthase enzyme YjbQ [Anaerolineales bacterium]|nr:secondary thiamine-phosphate synthase enzyme YjbQ [Anaerolineales bacterium]